MLKLFRKIRQRLLEQNKVTQYLTYAIGEIFFSRSWDFNCTSIQ